MRLPEPPEDEIEHRHRIVGGQKNAARLFDVRRQIEDEVFVPLRTAHEMIRPRPARAPIERCLRPRVDGETQPPPRCARARKRPHFNVAVMPVRAHPEWCDDARVHDVKLPLRTYGARAAADLRDPLHAIDGRANLVEPLHGTQRQRLWRPSECEGNLSRNDECGQHYTSDQDNSFVIQSKHFVTQRSCWRKGSEERAACSANHLALVKSATEELIGNAREHEADFEGPRALIPAKHVAIVTCMDSRIDNFRIFGLDSGEAHILRNAGGLVTDDVLRSLVVSQRLLETREVILMHHTNCGLERTDEPALRATISAEVGSAPPYAFGAFTDIDEAVRRAIRRVRDHKFLPHRDNVRGFVYEVESGHLREVKT